MLSDPSEPSTMWSLDTFSCSRPTISAGSFPRDDINRLDQMRHEWAAGSKCTAFFATTTTWKKPVRISTTIDISMSLPNRSQSSSSTEPGIGHWSTEQLSLQTTNIVRHISMIFRTVIYPSRSYPAARSVQASQLSPKTYLRIARIVKATTLRISRLVAMKLSLSKALKGYLHALSSWILAQPCLIRNGERHFVSGFQRLSFD